MEEKNFNDFLKTALPNLNELVSADIVIGKEIKTEDGTTIIPVSKVNFGYGAGINAPTDKIKFSGGGGGGGVTVTPVGFLVINKDGVRLLQISSADNTADRLVNMVPDVIDKVQGIISKAKKDKEAKANIEEANENNYAVVADDNK